MEKTILELLGVIQSDYEKRFDEFKKLIKSLNLEEKTYTDKERDELCKSLKSVAFSSLPINEDCLRSIIKVK